MPRGLPSRERPPLHPHTPLCPPAAAQVSPQAALQLIRAGRHPLELQGVAHHLPRLQALLSGLLSASHRTFGTATTWSGEALPKDRGPQAALLGWLLRLLPLLEPAGWPGQPLDSLPG
jgi:hypothetical protein